MNGKHPIERDLRPVLLLVGHDDSVVHLAFDEPFENPEQMVRRHAEHRRAQAPELVERQHGLLRLRRSVASRFTRWISVPTAQIDPGALSVTWRMMYSVEPLSSAACTTSHGTSGCTMTRTPGCCSRMRAICATVKRSCTEQCPFHRIIFASSTCSSGLAAVHLVRIPHDHLVERHTHLVRGVAAEMLIGKEQNALAALQRPSQRRRAVGRRADDAAALADEGFDGRGRVDVGDRERRLPIPIMRRARPSRSRADRSRPCRPSSSRRQGRAGSPSDAAPTARRRFRP